MRRVSLLPLADQCGKQGSPIGQGLEFNQFVLGVCSPAERTKPIEDWHAKAGDEVRV